MKWNLEILKPEHSEDEDGGFFISMLITKSCV